MDTTLAKGLALLDWLTRQQRACGVSEAARALGLARSNAHRTLQTLVACGWAEQDDAGAYRPTLRLFELGMQVQAAVDVAARVRPHLAALAASSGETIHLARRDGADIVYLDKFDSPLPVAAYSRVGGRAPAYCVASGKALLAAERLDGAALQAVLGVLGDGPLVAHTPHSITSIAALQADLQRSALRGYAENREEWRLGVCGLGAPLFDARGWPVAAVGISVPAIRCNRTQARALAEKLLACAAAASSALGFIPDRGTDRGVPPRPVRPQRRLHEPA
jgi:DNA-binding IclR family transcriptional regulator